MNTVSGAKNTSKAKRTDDRCVALATCRSAQNVNYVNILRELRPQNEGEK